MSGKFSRWIVLEVMRPVVLIGSTLEKLHKLLFGRRLVRLSIEDEEQLALDVRSELPFLFSEYGGKIIPDATVKYPRPFDYASVIVAVDGLLIRFFRGREELRVWVTPKSAPNDWDELPLVLRMVVDASEWAEPKPFLFLQDVARALKTRMVCLIEAFSEERYPDLKKRLSDMHKHERAVIRQWETETNRRLYPDR
jgi:hypothetical protein